MTTKLNIIVLIALTLSASQCGQDDSFIDNNPIEFQGFRVLAHSPFLFETNVPGQVPVDITFSRPIDAASVQTGITVESGSNNTFFPVTNVTTQVAGSNRVLIYPSGNWAGVYRVRVNGVRSATGEQVQGYNDIIFSTFSSIDSTGVNNQPGPPKVLSKFAQTCSPFGRPEVRIRFNEDVLLNPFLKVKVGSRQVEVNIFNTFSNAYNTWSILILNGPCGGEVKVTLYQDDVRDLEGNTLDANDLNAEGGTAMELKNMRIACFTFC